MSNRVPYTAPTRPTSDSSNAIATTAFAHAVGAGGGNVPVGATEGFLLQTHGNPSNPTWEGFTQSGANAVVRTWQDKARDEVNAKDFGAKCDGIYVTGTTAITSGANALTVTGASYIAGDVGKRIVVPGAGAAGVPLSTTIAGWTSSTQITLTANASTSVNTSTQVFYGTDDYSAIQSAINSLPTTGGTVIIPGICAHATGLVIGNGNSTTASTRWGVRLRGTAVPVFHATGSAPDALYPNYAAGLVYVGAYDTNAVQLAINGPLRGFEVSYLQLDGLALCKTGLQLYGASFGVLDVLSFTGHIGAGLYTTAPSTSTFADDGNSSHITSKALYFRPPNLTNAAGAYLDGATDGTSDTHSIIIHIMRVHHPENATTYGIVFRVCDTITINNMLQIANSGPTGTPPYGGNANCIAVAFDYSVASGEFPNDVYLNKVDVGFGIAAGRQFVNIGTPSAVAVPLNNLITRLGQGNGGNYPKVLANTLVDLPMKQLVDVDLVNANAAVGVTTIFTPKQTGMYRISYYIECTVVGTGGTFGLILGFGSPGGLGKGYVAPTCSALSTAAHAEGVVAFNCVVSQPIIYEVLFNSVTGTPQFSLCIRVEKLD